MRAFCLLLLAACLVSASPFDQIDCWAVRDSIAHAVVGADVVVLGGDVMSWALYNASADTTVNVGFAAVDDTTALSAFIPIAKATWSGTFSCGVPGTYGLRTLYVSYADSTGAGDPVYILCWGHKD